MENENGMDLLLMKQPDDLIVIRQLKGKSNLTDLDL
eukprot:CAMPEP_0176463894 /NCGR_PEP_ID=MMETSP0127-20121128/36174_1 /TAXON_ID=938130 /ORGANISM="Platyophrya macrostoma, Strain WH" /LENGTH=35 /DNA_ID= /DNA_START= /DNA_END= /DNA_ORIENTATION=